MRNRIKTLVLVAAMAAATSLWLPTEAPAQFRIEVGPKLPPTQPRGAYQIVLSSPRDKGLIRANTSDLVFKVVPVRARVSVDGRLIGSARDFSTKRNSYTVMAGEHDLRVEYPGYRVFSARMEVVPDQTLHLDIELERLPGE